MNVFFIETSGLDEVAIQNGFRWLIGQCRSKGKEGVIATPQQQSISNAFTNMNISNASIKQFLQNKGLQINGIQIQLLTSRIPIPLYHDGIILAVHPSKQLLATIGKLPNIDSVLVIPWRKNDCQEWLNNKNANELDI